MSATTGYICKRCGAESPVGIGYAGQPDVASPAQGCPNPHEPSSSDTRAARRCFCPGDCNCQAPAWMHRPVFCGCRGTHS